MRTKFSIIISCLMVLSLIVISCGTEEKVTDRPLEDDQVVISGTETPARDDPTGDTTQAVTPDTKVPTYGGRIRDAIAADYTAFDPTLAMSIRVGHMQFTSNKLIMEDWTKGPQGTGETNWDWGFLGNMQLMAGELVRSWEFPDSTTIIYHLHEGVRFHDRPPVNGRELTAADVVWNIEMQFNYPSVWQSVAYPPDEPARVTGKILPGDPRRPTSVRAIDRYTVEVKVPADSHAMIFMEMASNMFYNPPEVWEDGGPGMTEWQNVVGSGPWIFADYVPASTIRYTRHPDYFQYDPLYPGNRWPYLDSVTISIITDLSSRVAAFRTGTIDIIRDVTFDDARQLISHDERIQWARKLATGNFAGGKLDDPSLPFYDIRVRQAMNLAVDQEEILRDYFMNEGVILGYPFQPTPDFDGFFTPLEQMPDEVRMLYTYDPERAKQLLAEAGYPEGFKTNIVCTIAAADEVALLQAYLEKVGIEMSIQPVETGQWNTMRLNRSFSEMFYGPAAGVWAPFEQLMTKTGMMENFVGINDPYFAEVGRIIARDIVRDPENYVRTMREAAIYELSLAWGIFMPARYVYAMWWPWVENWYGVTWIGWAGHNQFFKGIWLNQQLKRSMGF